MPYLYNLYKLRQKVKDNWHIKETKLWKIFLLNLKFIGINFWMANSLRLKIKLVFRIYNFYKSNCLRQMFPLVIRKVKKYNFPRAINIETISFCNSRCIICPASNLSKELPQGKMSQGLYQKIIDECSNYHVLTIYPSFSNEPLLDENLISSLKYAKEKLPKTKIFLSTNASLLTSDKIGDLLKYVDIFSFSVFGNTKQEYEKMMPGLDFEKTVNNIVHFVNYKKKKGIQKISFVKQILTQGLIINKDFSKEVKKIYNFWQDKGILWIYRLFFSRADNVKSYHYARQRKKNLRGCWAGDFPLERMNIKFNGDVVLCCMDFRAENILGNVSKQNIYEIWNGKLYNDIRDRIYLNKNNDNNFICNRCYNPYFSIY